MSYPEDYQTLEGIEASIWQLLLRAVKDRRSPGHTPTVGTVGADGEPRLRTVVFRGCDPIQRELMFHTDVRSPKWSDLKTDKRIAMHFYFPKKKLQFRVQGTARLEHNTDATRAKWDSMNPGAHDCYRVTTTPGAPIDEPRLRAEETAGDHDGYQAFARVHIQVGSIDWLYLAAIGHRRAQFTWGSDGTLNSRWVGP